jgi:phosphoribosylanthranilate isomerase
MTWIKICGTTNLIDAQAAVTAGADALGFIFAPSPRQITAEAAAEIIDALSTQTKKIGVTVNQSPEEVAKLAQNVGLTGLQLHGDELGDQMWAYRSALAPRMIIKTLQAQQVLACGDDFLYSYLRVSEFFDAVLLDAGTPNQPGGTGVPFDWNALAPIVSHIQQWSPVIIAGGLTQANVSQSIRLFAPWGVDVVSGVESEPGRKDPAKLTGFVAAVRDSAGNIQSSLASHGVRQP